MAYKKNPVRFEQNSTKLTVLTFWNIGKFMIKYASSSLEYLYHDVTKTRHVRKMKFHKNFHRTNDNCHRWRLPFCFSFPFRFRL